MRTKNSLRNVIYNVFSFFLNMVLMFILRKVMVLKLGYEYVGLNTFLISIVGFLSLTELGVGQAVTYSLYKPLSEKNYNKISEIIALYKKIYNIIGIFIVLFSILISPFLKYFIKGNNLNRIWLYFILYGILTSLSYFISYRDILINADQKGYLIIKINTIFIFINKIIQILIIYLTESYLIWIISMIIITMINLMYNNFFIENKYKEVNINIYKKYKLKNLLKSNRDLLKNSYTTFIYKIASFITYKTDDILIINIVGVQLLGKYANYILITSSVANVIAAIFWSLNSIVGNLIVESSKDKIYQIWKNLTWLSFYIATVLSFSILINIQQLIKIWIGESSILSFNIVLLLMINFFIRIVKEPLELFRNGFGIFTGTKGIISLEALLNLIISYILGIRYGIRGVLLGTILSYMLCSFWFIPKITFKEGFKKNLKSYYIEIGKNIFISLLSIKISSIFLRKIDIKNFYMLSFTSFMTINFVYIFFNIKNKNLRKILEKIIYHNK